MCWNKDVSIHTFIFTTFILILIAVMKHKPMVFDNIFMYIFLISFTSMQLFEYFIWVSIETNNTILNKAASFGAWFLIRVLQPMSVLFLLPEKYTYLRTLLLPGYIISFIGTTIYKSIFNPIQFKTVINKNGHLEWIWNELDGCERINVLLYFLCISTLFIKFPIGFILSMIALSFSVFRYKYTWGSNWCYLVNTIMVYYLIDIFYRNI